MCKYIHRFAVGNFIISLSLSLSDYNAQSIVTAMSWGLEAYFIISHIVKGREMTEQKDWRAKQPSKVACFSEDLKC